MKKLALVFISMIITVLISCGGGGGDGDGASREDGSYSNNISFIDISDAEVVSVVPANTINYSSSLNAAKSPSLNRDRFIKIKHSGQIEEINVKDKSGKSIAFIPTRIENINDDFMLFCNNSGSYLVHKSTGNTYFLSETQPDKLRANAGYNGEKRQSIFTDDYKNIYCLFGGRVYKINYSNLNSLTKEPYTPDIYSISEVSELSIDKEGNVLFSYTNYSASWTEYLKIRTKTGRILNVDENNSGAWCVFRGLDGNNYEGPDCYLIENDEINKVTNIYKSMRVLGGSQASRWFYFPDKIVTVNKSNYYPNKAHIVDVYSSDENLNNTEIGIGGELVFVKQSSNYIYISTSNGAIIRISPVDNSYVTILSDNQYDIYNFAVTSNNLIIFNALDLSNSHKILGKIDNLGNVEIVKDNLESNITLLERIR